MQPILQVVLRNRDHIAAHCGIHIGNRSCAPISTTVRSGPFALMSYVKPTFPKWPAFCREDRLTAPPDQAVSAPSGVCGRAHVRSWANWPANPQHPGPAATFFSASGRLVLPLSFSFGLDRGHAHSGGARNRRMAARMARTIGPVTATSASWKVMARA